MYTIQSFRYTEYGWFADVLENGAMLTYSIALRDVEKQDCQNFGEAYITVCCLPYQPHEYGVVFDVPQPEPETVADQNAATYGELDLGSRFTISGGEVEELDNRPNGGDAEMPF